MAKLAGQSLEALARLEACLELEIEEAKRRSNELREGKSTKALEADGLLARKVRIRSTAAQLLGRARVVFGEDPSRPGHLDGFSARPGSVVEVRGDPTQTGASGVVVPARRGTVAVIFDHPLELEDDDAVDLILTEDELTHRRLISALRKAKEPMERRQIEVLDCLLGAASPAPASTDLEQALDEALNGDQRIAAGFGSSAPDIALIHGPFGTGKTRVLVEVVRRAVANKQRVLAAAASNAAADNLALAILERAPGITLTRVGHPARAHASLEAHTLAAQTASHDMRRIARGLVDEAFRLLKQARRSASKGKRPSYEEREKRREASQLFREARKLEKRAAATVVDCAQVISGTLTGFATDLPDDLSFDLLVIDEASQAITPAVVAAACRAKRIVLAGDHRQLPPTVISGEAKARGLDDTAFEALIQREGGDTYSHMLTVQHRMPDMLMRFPSERFYSGRLSAHEALSSVEGRLEVIDTAGAGMSERTDSGSLSKHNPEQAELVSRRVRELTSEGFSPREIAVITPYSAQVAQLRQLLSDLLDEELEIDSVDAFQGREKRAVVFDAVRSNDEGSVGFLSDARRLNVAITRAQERLVIIGDSATLSHDEVWAALFDDAMTRGAYKSSFEILSPY